MKRIIYIVLFFICSFVASASHITGGEMYYTFIGMNNGQFQYSVTLKLFQRCNSGRQFPNPNIISIFNKATNARVSDISVPITREENIKITNPDPCITNPPSVCYDVAYYTFTVSLPASGAGYLIASQVNYRIAGIDNLSPGYNNVGATYTADIPGTGAVANAATNNSAAFTGSDLVVVCANNNFSYSFGATDPDGDELRYSFCEAYASTSSGGGTFPSNPPPIPSIPYNEPAFSSTAPLGSKVQINPTTGLVTGIAPAAGTYVVTVCVEEVRNGIVIARQRKDLQISIANCDVAAASLLPEYLLCRNTQTITIKNLSNSPLIASTDWEFFDNTNTLIFSSASTTVTYTFPAVGLYTVKLIINRNKSCTDSTTALVRVFPGFNPDFTSTGVCVTKPTFFIDGSTSVYGTVNSWKWNFGEPSTSADSSSIQNPTYTYPVTGVKNVELIATDTKGCRDTIIKPVNIIDKPPLTLSFRDTLICINDKLMLQATGNGNFSWTPAVNVSNPNTATPTVSPSSTSTYFVTLDDNGCLNKDSVKVNVVPLVTLQTMNDTIICRGDTIQLRIISDGLQYAWTPMQLVSNPIIKNPFIATTNAQTTFTVKATIGGCSATKNINVTTVPYPYVNAGEDFSICYNTLAQLNGTTDGNSWNWSPGNNLNNATILNPTGYPSRSTDFILTAFDTKGCPKPSRDTVSVKVLPKINVSAGRDTAVVAGQPLQLNAIGGIRYDWSPPDNLTAINIPNPIAIFSLNSEAIRYKVVAFSEEGCKDSAFINVKIFKTKPTIFVPTAFTPNSDGLNDILRPIAVGIHTIEYFNIYNRWGQLLFSGNSNGIGWDGRINGILQTTGTFVWTAKAIDYTGASYFQKGVVTLIR